MLLIASRGAGAGRRSSDSRRITTAAGGHTGCLTGCGTVFKLAPNGSGGYTESLLYAFPSGTSGDGGANGATPKAGLIMDGAGNLYGTTADGALGYGTVFELAPDGSGGYTESVLYSFGTNDSGEFPNTPLIIDRAGNLYGITAYGGDNSYDQCGSVFRLAPNGSGGYTETGLYMF